MLRQIIGICLLCIALTTGACNRCHDGCIHGICKRSSCSCDQWYEGDACDRSVLSQYAYAYEGVLYFHDSTSAPLSFELTLSNSPDQLLMSNPSLELSFTSLTRFDVLPQLLHGEWYEGEGEMLLNLLSLRVHRINDDEAKDLRIEAHRLSD